MLLHGKESKALLAQARKERFAIGAFNVNDYMTVEATLQAAEELGVPVIIQTWDYFDPAAPEGSPMSEAMAQHLTAFILQRAQASPVPVIIHLDHCNTFEGCIRGIQAGAASVMLDASMKPFEENVALTAKVVEAAHGAGVIVEGEIGHVTGHANSTGAVYTEVDAAQTFVEQSGIDMVAVSIGTVHGVYASEPVLHYQRIAELRDAFEAPLVMHGSSGLKPEQFKQAIANGIVKINFGTYTQLEGAKATLKAAEGVEKPWFQDLVNAGMDGAKAYLKQHMEIFGTKRI